MPTPAQVNWAKFRAAAVAFLALCILSTLSYLLSGGTVFQPKTSIYLYVPDSTGIGYGSPVRVDGIDVGKVDNVALSGSTQPNRIVRIRITIGREWLGRIPVDSYAELSADTLIGDKFVDVTSGVSRAFIRPNGELHYKEKADMLKTLDVHQFRQQLDAVSAQITEIEEGRGLVGQFVQGTGFYEEWRKLLRESQNAMNALVAREGNVGSLVYTDREYQALHRLVQGLDQSLARLQSGQGALGRMLRDDAQYQQWMADLGGVQQSIAGVREGPFFQSAAAYNDWSRQLGGVIRAVDQFNASPVMATPAVYESLDGMTRELQKNLRDFRQDPRKYLRLKLF